MPAPLAYALGLVGPMHFGVWLLVPIALGVSIQDGSVDINLSQISVMLVLLALGYLLFMPMIGQIFGDHYSFAQVWPASAILGVLISAAFVGFVAISDPKAGLGFAFVAFAVFSVFLGLALNLFLWLMPRMVRLFAMIDLPKYSWGVSL